MYKIIFTDLDGTIVPESQIISDYTKEVITQVRKLGIPFILASGRANHSMRTFHEALGLDEVMISYNGALIDVAGEAHYYQPLPEAVAQKLYRFAQEEKYYFQFYHQDALYTLDSYAEHSAYLAYSKNNRVALKTIAPDSELLQEALKSVTKWMFIEHDRVKLESIAEALAKLLPGEAAMSFTSDAYFEIYHHDVNKGNALLQVLKEYGLDASEALSFGDNFNDIELLEVAGMSYAMKNASPQVQARAKRVTSSSVDEDGVAKVLAELFLHT
ncbi:HAD family hydrolase [Entomospira culicis]|uniref:HAD family hydrolase n=1 Tax=Entomospira culicis TaxID=2719989 RepID=A0A968GJA6_9SPIO|nr:HAD family hydrolase [Entomospira culicis]NIZ19868.1 HAD family hydrolase [Entomospira culicis]NIZ70082.1 HAD family hydrolase [Entomospira culicis]WDI37186.1 HAD family hydrolase [Entomospira culicis]WDI38815.1 HAD family hydrolase [Entomospira culicis]